MNLCNINGEKISILLWDRFEDDSLWKIVYNNKILLKNNFADIYAFQVYLHAIFFSNLQSNQDEHSER